MTPETTIVPVDVPAEGRTGEGGHGHGRGRRRRVCFNALIMTLIILLTISNLMQMPQMNNIFRSNDAWNDSSFSLSSLLSSSTSHCDSSSSTTRSSQNNEIIIHWNSTVDHVNPPTIYTCTDSDANGFREAKKILSSALPEYKFVNLGALNVGSGKGPNKIKFPSQYLWDNFTNVYDIYIDTFHGPCPNSFISNWLLKNYNGHLLFFSGESEKLNPVNHFGGNKRNHFHAFGPLLYPNPQTDIILTYMQYVWWDQFQYILTPDVLLDSTKRPKVIDTTSSQTDISIAMMMNNKPFLIYANSNCVPFREQAVARLSQFGVIHCDGKCQGKRTGGIRDLDIPQINRTNIINTHGKHGIGIRNWWQNVEVYKEYLFCFVFEHELNHPTYITEKILMAFSAGCIPIYYGPNLIFDIFNSKAFVFYNVSNPQPALDQIQNLRNNVNNSYIDMLNEPLLAHGEITLEHYFSFNDTIGNGKLKRQIRQIFGLTNENFVP